MLNGCLQRGWRAGVGSGWRGGLWRSLLYLTTLYGDGSLLVEFGIDSPTIRLCSSHARFSDRRHPKELCIVSIDHFVSDEPIKRVDFETPRNEGGTSGEIGWCSTTLDSIPERHVPLAYRNLVGFAVFDLFLGF